VFSPREAGLLLDELAGLPGRPREQALRDDWPRLIRLDTTHPRVVARVAWDIDDAEAALDALPAALEHERLEDGADVFLWRIGLAAADLGGFFELYLDRLVAWTFCAIAGR
jgi:hypothetical protein